MTIDDFINYKSDPNKISILYNIYPKNPWWLDLLLDLLNENNKDTIIYDGRCHTLKPSDMIIRNDDGTISVMDN